MTSPHPTDLPWYRQRMVWLVIAIPGLTVVGCLLTIYLAVSNPETIVTDPLLDSSPSTRIPREALP